MHGDVRYRRVANPGARVREPEAMMATQAEAAAMQRALEAAEIVPRTLPNPRVGCALIDAGGELIALGIHRGAGSPHAEVDALSQVGDLARGATAVVTLEPCNHTGRTGPCAEALIQAGIARVVYAQSDPNPVAAGGAETLRAAGIDVEGGVLKDDVLAMNRAWSFSVGVGRPFVTWKYAATLDGRSAATDGTSQWITGQTSRDDVHYRRAEVDAIAVGTGTVLADNPHLTVRENGQVVGPQPLRVVVGDRDIPSTAKVLDDAADTIHLRTRDPHEVLLELADREIRHVWLEGGPTLAGAFWSAGLIDEVIAYVAPAILGAGRAPIESDETSIGDLRMLDIHSVDHLDNDLRIIGTPRWGGQ